MSSSLQQRTAELDAAVSSGHTASEALQKLRGEAAVLQQWQQAVQAERAAELEAVRAAKQVCVLSAVLQVFFRLQAVHEPDRLEQQQKQSWTAPTSDTSRERCKSALACLRVPCAHVPLDCPCLCFMHAGASGSNVM